MSPRALLVLLPLLAACRAVAPPERVERDAAAMGTTFRIVLYGEPGAAAAAAERALARVHELDALLSDYDPESELSRLSRTTDAGVPEAPTRVGPELWDVLVLARELAAASDGAFDVTVGPLVRLWRRARRQGELPEASRVREALAAVGSAHLELGPGREVRLTAAGMRLDLGGIAKGQALDEAARVLRAGGFERFLIDGGGDLLLGAPPPDAPGWRVELEGFRQRELLPPLTHVAVATSGDLERYVELDGVRYSHLVDPRTGQALVERRLVSVIAATGAEADGLASAVSVLGPDAGLRLLAARGARGRVLGLAGGEGRVCATPDFPETLFSRSTAPAPRTPPGPP